MLGKILLTITILLLGIVWIRQAREHKRQGAAAAGQRIAAPAPAHALNDYRFAAWLFLALMLGLGGLLYYQQWQEDNKIVHILLHREGNSAPVTYDVRQRDLEERAFTTVEGIRVTVAASERMEVIGLQDPP
jgi:hypothetical protein